MVGLGVDVRTLGWRAGTGFWASISPWWGLETSSASRGCDNESNATKERYALMSHPNAVKDARTLRHHAGACHATAALNEPAARSNPAAITTRSVPTVRRSLERLAEAAAVAPVEAVTG